MTGPGALSPGPPEEEPLSVEILPGAGELSPAGVEEPPGVTSELEEPPPGPSVDPLEIEPGPPAVTILPEGLPVLFSVVEVPGVTAELPGPSPFKVSLLPPPTTV